MEESEIAKELRSQGVLAIKRISVRYDCMPWPSMDKQFQNTLILAIWKLPLYRIFQTLKDVFNARNSVIQKINAKEKLFALDVAKKGIL